MPIPSAEVPWRSSAARAMLSKAFSASDLAVPVKTEPQLSEMARCLGADRILRRPLNASGVLIPSDNGYVVAIKEGDSAKRQRFSLAHEIGHLLLHRCRYSGLAKSITKHRASYDPNDDEERLCDQIAAEILMPQLAFEEDGWMEGWSLKSLRPLSGKYQTSIPATAIRMIDLMPETSLLAVWRPPSDVNEVPKLQWSHAKSSRYGVPGVLPRRRLWLIARAMNAHDVQSGIAPVVDKVHKAAVPPDAPAEALAWGQGEHRQVMVFYYPERELTDDMLAIAKATWRTD